MTLFTIVIISVGLAMDAFAVSISEGVSFKRMHIKHSIVLAGLFGIFQAFMPLVGYAIGSFFYEMISVYSRYISFILLVFIGIKMIYEGYNEELCEKEGKCELSTNHIFLAIATSIDALAIGFSFSFLNLNIYKAISIIGIITFIISFGGVYIGYKIGKFCNTKVEYIGGLILIIMGIKSLFV
jgi:putative Mn2+ efflux pump MntP